MWRAYHTKRPFSLKRALFFYSFSSCVFPRTFPLTPFSSHLFVKRCCQKLLGDTAYLYPTLLSLKGGLWSLENLRNLGSLGYLRYLGYLRSLRLPPLLFLSFHLPPLRERSVPHFFKSGRRQPPCLRQVVARRL